MTRENIKQYLLQIKQKDGDEVLSNRWQPDILVEIIDKIYDEHEPEMKQAYIDGSNSCNELIQSLYKQIEQPKDKQ